jgi:hypothetical protein
MQWLAYGLLALFLGGGAWCFSRSVNSRSRNKGDLHGEGTRGIVDGADMID